MYRSVDMSATMPLGTCERPKVEWRWPCGANLPPRAVHWIVLATSSADPGSRTPSGGVLCTMCPKSSARPLRVASSKRSSPSSDGGGVRISSGVFGGIRHLLSAPSQHPREGRPSGLQQLFNGDRQGNGGRTIIPDTAVLRRPRWPAGHRRRSRARSVATRPPQTPCWPMSQCRSDSSRHCARTGQLVQTAIAAAASWRALAGSLLTGYHWSGSRPLSAHRACLATRAHKASPVNRWTGRLLAMGPLHRLTLAGQWPAQVLVVPQARNREAPATIRGPDLLACGFSGVARDASPATSAADGGRGGQLPVPGRRRVWAVASPAVGPNGGLNCAGAHRPIVNVSWTTFESR